ncbi:PREDICTED: uncharacterized protein LOC101370258 [Odobenus rosmarus divergens]|uniref:Uncharacterized protein LOC101370258 n=1 Tax=Odobenus rosmarus divergens TaxID=9708 RepID=A0A9B0G3E2_ODORO
MDILKHLLFPGTALGALIHHLFNPTASQGLGGQGSSVACPKPRADKSKNADLHAGKAKRTIEIAAPTPPSTRPTRFQLFVKSSNPPPWTANYRLEAGRGCGCWAWRSVKVRRRDPGSRAVADARHSGRRRGESQRGDPTAPPGTCSLGAFSVRPRPAPPRPAPPRTLAEGPSAERQLRPLAALAAAAGGGVCVSDAAKLESRRPSWLLLSRQGGAARETSGCCPAASGSRRGRGEAAATSKRGGRYGAGSVCGSGRGRGGAGSGLQVQRGGAAVRRKAVLAAFLRLVSVAERRMVSP